MKLGMRYRSLFNVKRWNTIKKVATNASSLKDVNKDVIIAVGWRMLKKGRGKDLKDNR